MGPRSEDRGNELRVTTPDAANTASMGPRSEDRGNEAVSCESFLVFALLQWGRDLKIAEIRPVPLSSARHPRFNGAAI